MNSHRTDITAILLAGGLGARLGGQDKGLARLNGRPLIEHVLEHIEPQVALIIISANRNQDVYRHYGHLVISDELSDYQGPLAGIAACLPAVQTPLVVTLPCDGPQIPPDLVRRLDAAMTTAKANIATAHDGQRLQSLYLCFRNSLQVSIEQYLADGGRSVHGWLQKQEYGIADFFDQPQNFTNINTQQQLDAIDYGELPPI